MNNTKKLKVKLKNMKFLKNIYVKSLLSYKKKKEEVYCWDWKQGDQYKYPNRKLTYYYSTDNEKVKVTNKKILKTINFTNIEKKNLLAALKSWTVLIGMPIEEVFNKDEANLIFNLVESKKLAKKFDAISDIPAYNIVNQLYFISENSNFRPKDLKIKGNEYYHTMIHEMGHALGLSHPHDNKFKFPESNEYKSGKFKLDNVYTTVMSYIKLSKYRKFSNNWSSVPMAFDIVAMDVLYGLDKKYEANKNIYHIKPENTDFVCIYNLNKDLTIIYEGIESVIIDLRPATLKKNLGGGGYISKIQNQKKSGGFTISNYTEVKNAISGQGDDIIYDVDKISNIINGNEGIDTVIYEDIKSNYKLVKISDKEIHVISKINNNIKDILLNIEFIKFKNKEIKVKNIIL